MAGAVLYARLNGLQLLSVQSDSMQPTFNRGDAVMIDRSSSRLADAWAVGTGLGGRTTVTSGRDGTDRRTVRQGDVVSYFSPRNADVIITHRIVEVDASRDYIVTRGDAERVEDLPFRSNRLYGKVVHAVPLVGFGLDTARQPIGLAVTIFLPAVYIACGEVKRLSRHYSRQRYILLGYLR
jgi:signal peptidase I